MSVIAGQQLEAVDNGRHLNDGAAIGAHFHSFNCTPRDPGRQSNGTAKIVGGNLVGAGPGGKAMAYRPVKKYSSISFCTSKMPK